MKRFLGFFSLCFLSLGLLVAFGLLVSCGGGSASANEMPVAAIDPSDNSGFVELADVVPDVILEIRYYSTYNFVGCRIDGYEQPVALCTREAAEALARAADTLRRLGYRIMVFDAYRPQMAVDHFLRWARDPSDTAMKPFFYPSMRKNQIMPQNYLSSRSGHTRGSTFDLTLFDEASGHEADMGGTFDFFGEISHPYYNGISNQQRQNRMLLRNVMLWAGFRPLHTEWWHFTLRNEPYPTTYFTFPVKSL